MTHDRERVHCGDAEQKDNSCPGWDREGQEQGGSVFHHTAQNGTQLKTSELFISGTFHLIFLDPG